MSARKAASAAGDLLLEIGTEDLPARYVVPLASALAHGIVQGLSSRVVKHGGSAETASRLLATPRRIAVLVPGVAQRQEDRHVERKGPKLSAALKDGEPTPAGLGFARSCGVEFSELDTRGGQLVHRSVERGRPTAELLPEIFEEALKKMDEVVPKRMRWGSGDETFVRPVQWLVCLLGPRTVALERFGLKAGNRTFGHRFHAPGAIVLRTPAEYEKKLRAARVWVDFETRKAEIRRQAEAEAKKLEGAARITAELLDEVAALVEWPVAVSGRIEPRFLELPPEVVIATIEHNQRYFPVFSRAVTRGGKLLPHFITVANLQSKDRRQVIAGNERVVVPRLTDAMFFWQQDRRKRLSDYVPSLSRVTYQKELGSIGDKVARVDTLAVHVAALLGDDPKPVRHAALLCKADLVTRMVFEFPELQGVMGGYYAKLSGESDAVATAIREHYQPTHSGGPVPSTRGGQILALADKLDTLAGIFAIGQRPTASRDPFALRRAALGVLRICIEGALALDLRALVRAALETQPAGKRDAGVAAEIWEFLQDRLRGIVLEGGAPVEVFNAVAAVGTAAPLDFAARVSAVRDFLRLKESAQLAAAHKRIRNILKQAGEGDIEVRTDHFREREERALHAALVHLDGRVGEAAQRADYTGGLRSLAELQAPVDAFFDKVMVMAPEEELRANRVALLRQLDHLCRRIADISCLPG